MPKGGPLQRGPEQYTVTPLTRPALQLSLAPRAFALLQTTGRRSGLLRQTPVGIGFDARTAWLVAEHGARCDDVKNLMAQPQVRFKVRRRWYSGTAILVADDDSVARRRAIDAGNGLIGRLDGIFFHLGASTPCTARIDLE
jgi:deazaflavin-dependent oxidoreductase (nitroreductase family)